jgi:hypothetical protein
VATADLSEDQNWVVSVVDTLTLEMAAEIRYARGRAPWILALDPGNRFLFAAGADNKVQVVDIRPESNTFHEVILDLALPRRHMANDGLTVSRDGRHLYVSTYEDVRLEGNIVVFDISSPDPRDWQMVADKPLGTDRVASAHPFEITTTDDPHKLLVTPRLNNQHSSIGHSLFTLEVTEEGSRFGMELDDILTVISVERDGPEPWYHTQSLLNPYDVEVVEWEGETYALVSDINGSFFGAQYSFGSKVGVIWDPFAEHGGPELIGSTTAIERGYAAELALSPDRSRLLVSYNGIGEVLVMDVDNMIRVAKNLSPEERATPIDQVPDNAIHITPLTLATGSRNATGSRGISFQIVRDGYILRDIV